MDRFQMIQHASKMKNLHYDNHPNRAGFVDLTLRLGLPNRDYCNNNPTNISQSLNSDVFGPQQASLADFNGSHISISANVVQRSDYDHHDRAVMDAGEEEEEVALAVEDHVIDGDGANKSCSNPNCRTQTTPMWRRGPLGPKSLCNACGIKYRKQEEKRAAAVATATAGNSSGTSSINGLNSRE